MTIIHEKLHEHVSDRIIRAALEVHKHLGPGLLESAYEACLFEELNSRQISVARQVSLPIVYKGARLDCGYRLDLVVEDSVVVEVKTVENLLPVHHAQLLSYLRLSGYKVGLLINFNVKLLKDGIKRIVNEKPPRSHGVGNS